MLFELRDVSLSRGGRQVLDSVSAEIPVGAAAIVGPSGSGKSTLLRLLNRLADPDTGTVSYRDRPLRRVRPAGAAPRGLAGPAAAGAAGGTVAVEPALRGAAGRHASSTRDAASQLAGLDPGFAERDVAKLSVGEQQRAMLARALRSAARRAAARRADLGARPGGPRRGRGDPGRAAPRAGRSRSCSSATIPSRRGGWPTGWCGSTTAGRSPPGRCERVLGVSASIHVALWQVAASLVLVAIASRSRSGARPTSSRTSRSRRCARSSS